ncbi:GINS complex Psf1 component [Irpex rosettiformis]|uniref:GINS complex Psf1 component n=1 Tax=Irpex rosettiformis TaxID=378272 RepID=A0ACB8TSH4_9APHY|nr:GINS complex Psf1 component [Irpex rosettiformis]
MSLSTRQYGDLATQLVTESRRSTATDTLLKYNDVLVRSIIREQRQLETLIQEAMAKLNPDDMVIDNEVQITPDIILYQTTILRNKRCLLAYHHHRLERLKDLYWTVGGALPLILSTSNATASNTSNNAQNSDIRARLSPHEVDFLRAYNASILAFRSGVLATEEVDLFAPISRPPKDLHVHVKVVRDCGVIQTETSSI